LRIVPFERRILSCVVTAVDVDVDDDDDDDDDDVVVVVELVLSILLQELFEVEEANESDFEDASPNL
jgi:hypothetical protein